MPSRLSWPVMGGPTEHPTGVTLASDDPPNTLTVHKGWNGSRPRRLTAPEYVLEEGSGRWHAPAGGGGVGGRGVQDNWSQNVLPHRRGSSVVGGDLVGGGEGGESSFHPYSRGRGDAPVR